MMAKMTHSEKMRSIADASKRPDGTDCPLGEQTREAADHIDRLEMVVRMMRDRLLKNGEWDDGCFYYHGTSASEMQEPLALAGAVLSRNALMAAE